MKTKTCKMCKRTLPTTEFYRMSAAKDGYQYTCKDCWGKTYRHPNYKRLRTNRAATEIKRTGRGRSAKKTCTGCGELVLLRDFHKMTASPDGRAYECKDCKRKRWLAYYQDNKAWASLSNGERRRAKEAMSNDAI